jgi:hypothetical protein
MSAAPPAAPAAPTWLRRAAAALLVFEGLGGLWGGGALVARPDGSLMQLAPVLLERSPFADYLVPGLVLLAVNGLLPLVAAALWLRRHPWAPPATLLAGVLLSGWIACQVLFIRTFFPVLHVTYFALGGVLAGLGLAGVRRAARAGP